MSFVLGCGGGKQKIDQPGEELLNRPNSLPLEKKKIVQPKVNSIKISKNDNVNDS